MKIGDNIKNDKMNDILEFVSYQNEKNKKKTSNKKLIIVILNIATISSFIGVGYSINSFKNNKDDEKNSIKLEETLQSLNNMENIESSNEIEISNDINNDKEKEPEILEKSYQNVYDVLKKINKDTIGYLTVNGTRVSLPIVQSSNNDYYLTRDFEKNYSSLGWAFADYRNNFDTLDQNTIIYGHTYKDTAIFSSLQYTLNKSWFNNKDNHIIEFSIKNEDTKWQIFSIYTIDKTSDYLRINYNDDSDKFINTIIKRSKYDFNVDVDNTDNILTLSTCYITDKQRLVIHAKKIS